MMEIQNKWKDKDGCFFIEENDRRVAELVYRKIADDTLLLVHTEVDDSLAGKGVGKKLVDEAVRYARQHSYRLKAICPFAKKVLDRSPEYHDVYHPEKMN